MPDPPLVKVCGLTDPAEAAACVRPGVWAIGLVFAAESPRHVDVPRARRVVAALPNDVARVGVFVDDDPDTIAATAAAVGLTHVQLHGAGSDVEATRSATGCEVIRAYPVAGPEDVSAARASDADLVLLDAAVAGRHGGTGRTFDWSLLAGIDFGRPYLLAGGLHPRNVADAVRRLRPAMVDVSSGVEWAPGRKDPRLVQAFVEAVGWAAEVGKA